MNTGTEITFMCPSGSIGIEIENLLKQAGFNVTTILQDFESVPKVFVDGEIYPYKGKSKILSFIKSRTATDH
jgi:hypothetical protein